MATLKNVDHQHNYEVELVADSINESKENRITTYVLTYPRFIHAELMTHRVFSRNAMSSRAVPVQSMITHIEDKPAMPIHWGKNQPGMQADEEHNEDVTINLSWLMMVSDEEGESAPFSYTLPRNEAWDEGKKFAISVADGFAKAGYHKQIVNRLLETYQMIRTVVTATEYDNWYWLRDHSDAQPEIKHLASMMLELHNQSKPKVLHHTEWHVPFYADGIWTAHYTDNGIEYDRHNVSLSDALKVSSSCAAQASFRKADESIEKACRVYDRLVESEPVHASPFEHQAKPISTTYPAQIWEKGVTHVDRNNKFWSGNFQGWLQHRQLIKNHACWKYEGIK